MSKNERRAQLNSLPLWREEPLRKIFMQDMILHPGPLNHLASGPGETESALVYDDQHAALHRGALFARLSPLEYILVLALLRQRQRWQADPGHGVLCLSIKRLCDISGSESKQSVHRALNYASHKVEGLGIRIIRLHAENHYCVLFASEVEEQDMAEEDLLVVVSS